MKITFYALHGNGGLPEDWDLLKDRFSSMGCIWNSVSYQNTSWVHQICAETEKVYLLGHSWGCYQILKNWDHISKKIEKVIFINPYILPENRISNFLQFLLKIPFLGPRLLLGNHQKNYKIHFEKMIHPGPLMHTEAISRQIEKALAFRSEFQIWQSAYQNKINHQNEFKEIPGKNDLFGLVFWGEQDLIMNNSLQQKALKNQKYLVHRSVPGGGHGLVWTHQELLEKEIKNMIQKIGYYPGSVTENNVITYMSSHVENHPQKIALKWAHPESLKKWNQSHLTPVEHQEIDFKFFEDRIARVAKGLQTLGIQKGDRVIIFLPMALDMYVAMFAVQRIGAIAVFLDSWARSHHLGASADCVSPKAMISFSHAFALVDQVHEFSNMKIRILYGPGENGTHSYESLLKNERSEIEPVESEFSALITFTTGSTGKPKGANRTHRFLSAQHHALSHVIPYTDTDIDMPAFPIFSLNSLASGVTTVLPAVNLAQPSPSDSALLASQILSQKVTCTTLSPSMLSGLSDYCLLQNIKLFGLRRVVTGGAPISKDDVEKFYKIAPQSELWILYGSTEAEPMAHIEGRDMLKTSRVTDPEIVEAGVNVGEISEEIDSKFIKIKNGPIEWPPMGWSEIEVLAGEVGEFICTGDHVCREYYNNPEAFKSTKILDDNGKVWHRTGDLGFLDLAKNLWIVGRVNNVIRRKDKYLFPVRAEILLKRFDFVQRCAFLGLTDPILNEKAIAIIELKNQISSNFDKDEARKKIEHIFKKNEIELDGIEFVEKIPMDPRHHSKVEYSVLRKTLMESGRF